MPWRIRDGDLVVPRCVADLGFAAVYVDFADARGTVTRIDVIFSYACKLIALVVDHLVSVPTERLAGCDKSLVRGSECKMFEASVIVADVDAVGIAHQRESSVRCSCQMDAVPVDARTLVGVIVQLEHRPCTHSVVVVEFDG